MADGVEKKLICRVRVCSRSTCRLSSRRARARARWCSSCPPGRTRSRTCCCSRRTAGSGWRAFRSARGRGPSRRTGSTRACR
eukprot:676474-Prorocentrum_minimum.AAC.1